MGSREEKLITGSTGNLVVCAMTAWLALQPDFLEASMHLK